MLLDGHSASSVSKNLGINNTNLLYRWKSEILARSGPAAVGLLERIEGLRQWLLRELWHDDPDAV